MQAACCTWAWWVIWIYTKIAGNRRTQRIHLRHPSKPTYADLLGCPSVWEAPLMYAFFALLWRFCKANLLCPHDWLNIFNACTLLVKRLISHYIQQVWKQQGNKAKTQKKEDINNGSYSLSMYRREFEHVHNCSQSWSPIHGSWFTLKCKKNKM